MNQMQPGWYPQPNGQDRYFDGALWTDQYRPSQAQPMGQPTPAGATPMSHKDAKKLAKSTRPWWKKKRFILPILLLLLIFLATRCSGGNSSQPTGSSSSTSSASASSAAGSTSSAAASSAASVAGIGQTVKEGDIQFTINSWKCGATSVGTSPMVEKAQGEFCIADVVYKNVGKDPKTFDADTALTARQGDTKYKPSSMASITANNNSNTFLQQVNPGNSVTGKVVFDVPTTAKIDTVYILDGFTGDGTPIKVG